MSFKCLTCGAALKIRTSSDVTSTTRQVYYECKNEDCLEEYEGSHLLGKMVRPSKKLFAQISFDLFMIAVPAEKRAAVLQLINS